jgi:hypothetical protein
MTALSEVMAPKICVYCAQSDGEHCLADIPYYCVSLACSSFRETPAEPGKPIKRRRVNPLKALVETF